MIELQHVTKRYGRRGAGPDALHDVSLTVPAGSVWAVVGPNGAGKSTLLSLILGFLRPTAGSVLLDGAPPREFLRTRGASYLPERFTLPPRWKVGAALRMLCSLDRADDAAYERAVDSLGLAPHLDKRVSELSRGLLQRLGLAQAIASHHEIAVLDEPTEGLDPIWRVHLRDIVTDLRAAGSTVIIASHDLGEVERITDSVIVLREGRIHEVLQTQTDSAAFSYRILLAAPSPALLTAFPAAVPLDDLSYRVVVQDAHELSQRLAALIAAGGVVAAVEPVREPLEERVRTSLESAT